MDNSWKELRKHHRRYKYVLTICVAMITVATYVDPLHAHWVSLVTNILMLWDPYEV